MFPICTVSCFGLKHLINDLMQILNSDFFNMYFGHPEWNKWSSGRSRQGALAEALALLQAWKSGLLRHRWLSSGIWTSEASMTRTSRTVQPWQEPLVLNRQGKELEMETETERHKPLGRQWPELLTDCEAEMMGTSGTGWTRQKPLRLDGDN